MPKMNSFGERSLFFTYRKNEEFWRLSEKVAAVLERNFISDEGEIYTYSTGNIPNGTPYPPQFDVVYSKIPDPRAAFSFVQVKDFSEKKVGREFVDAVIGQQVQTGVQTCTIVSTRGFTNPALELARKQGVRLRILSNEATWPHPGYLPNNLKIRLEPQIRLQDVELILISPGHLGRLSLSGEELRKPILEFHGTSVSLESLFNNLLASPESRERVISEIENDLQATTVVVGEELEKRRVSVRIKDGIYAIKGIVYRGDIIDPPRLIDAVVSHRYRYYNPLSQKNLAWCAMAEFLINQHHEHDRNDSLLHFCLWRFSKGETDSVGGGFFQA